MQCTNSQMTLRPLFQVVLSAIKRVMRGVRTRTGRGLALAGADGGSPSHLAMDMFGGGEPRDQNPRLLVGSE